MCECDEERERARRKIAARVTRMTDEQRAGMKELQDAYGQCRRDYLRELYGKYPYDEPEMAQGEANAEEAHLGASFGNLLV